MAKIRAEFYQAFTDARIRKAIYQVFNDAQVVRGSWHQRFYGSIAIRQVVEQVFAVPELVRMVVEQDFAITASALRREFNQAFAVKDVDLLRKTVHQVFQLAGVAGEHRQYTVSISVDGALVPNPAKVNLERDIDQYYIEAIVTPAIQAHFVMYTHRAAVVLTINGQPYTLVVTTPQRSRAHGGGSYTVECQSPAVVLGEKYADTVSGEYIGFSSAIAAQLAPGFVIDWQIQDEYYRAGSLIVADQYPIEVIRELAAAVKGVVQSQPDGSLKVIRRRQVQVDQLQEVAPDYTLSDVDDFSTVSEEPLRRKRYNAYTVTNQATADKGLLPPEVTDISADVKQVRGYQVPWDGAFDLTHSGGAWVQIEPQGIEERVETETIEFVDGTGSTQYPIYGWSHLSWQATNLGTVTIAEDGKLRSTVVGESLLEFTYTTRCKLWQVTDPKNEQLQLVAQEAA